MNNEECLYEGQTGEKYLLSTPFLRHIKNALENKVDKKTKDLLIRQLEKIIEADVSYIKNQENNGSLSPMLINNYDTDIIAKINEYWNKS